MAINPVKLISYALQAKEVAEMAKPLVDAAAPAVERMAPVVKEKAVKAKDNVAQAADEARVVLTDKAKKAQEAKAEKKSVSACRKHAIEKAADVKDAQEFFRIFEKSIPETGEMASGYNAYCGCYAILTMPSALTKDLASYKDVYVGASTSVGFAVYQQLVGMGNVDVYADFKYKQPMKILMYPCNPDQLQAMYDGFLRDFDAVNSYNSWDVVASAVADNVQVTYECE